MSDGISEGIQKDFDSLIDYYAEMGDYIEHIKKKKHKLEKELINVLEIMEKKEYSTDNIRIEVKSSSKKNEEKENLIEYIIKYEKTKYIKISHSNELIEFLKKDKNKDIIDKYAEYIKDKEEINYKSRRCSTEHKELVEYIWSKKKNHFLKVELTYKEEKLSLENDRDARECLKNYIAAEFRNGKLEFENIRRW